MGDSDDELLFDFQPDLAANEIPMRQKISLLCLMEVGIWLLC